MKVPQPGVLAKDSFQNKRFKLIPSMVEAPWVVQMAVRLVNVWRFQCANFDCTCFSLVNVGTTLTSREHFMSSCKTNISFILTFSVFSSTPVLLGQKVVMRYFRGEGYLEMDVHVGSSAIADNIVGVCRSYGKAFICNLGEHYFFGYL